MITLVRTEKSVTAGTVRQGSSRDRSFKGKCGGRIFIDHSQDSGNRRREVVRAEEYKASTQWAEVLKFCWVYDSHGEMEFQSSDDGEFMACILWGKSFDVVSCLTAL